MNTIQNVKPDSFGKGKKKGGKKSASNKNAKFYLKAYLTSTQQKGSVNVDLRTLDVSRHRNIHLVYKCQSYSL